MKQHRILALFLSVLLLTALLTRCAASSKNMAADTPVRSAKLEDGERCRCGRVGLRHPAEAPAETETAWDDAADTGFTTSAAGNAELDNGRQFLALGLRGEIIYSANISAETTQFDEAVARIEAMVASYQGFVESSNVYGNTRYQRRRDDHRGRPARELCAAHPGETNLSSSCPRRRPSGNVLSSNRYAENVTSTYTDYEARLSSLRTQEERLLAMLERPRTWRASSRSKKRLADVRYETESIERNLRNMDMQIRYSTVFH